MFLDTPFVEYVLEKNKVALYGLNVTLVSYFPLRLSMFVLKVRSNKQVELQLLKYLRKWTVMKSYFELSEINSAFDKKIGVLKIKMNVKREFKSQKKYKIYGTRKKYLEMNE